MHNSLAIKEWIWWCKLTQKCVLLKFCFRQLVRWWNWMCWNSMFSTGNSLTSPQIAVTKQFICWPGNIWVSIWLPAHWQEQYSVSGGWWVVRTGTRLWGNTVSTSFTTCAWWPGHWWHWHRVLCRGQCPVDMWAWPRHGGGTHHHLHSSWYLVPCYTFMWVLLCFNLVVKI